MVKKIVLFSLFLINLFVFSQSKKLEDLSFSEIEKKIDSLSSNANLQKKIANFYLFKAKKENISEHITYAYRYLSVINNDLKYADSAIVEASKISNNKYLAEAYINKSSLLSYQLDYINALNYLFKAHKIANTINDNYLYYETLYFIAQNRLYIGQINEANKEFKDCIDYFKQNLDKEEIGKNYQTLYIYALIGTIDSNTKIGLQKQNTLLYKEAYNYIKKNKIDFYLPYFISSEGVDAYHSKDYNKAIAKLNQAIKQYNDNWTHFTEIYYIGLSYWKLNEKKIAIKYFEKIDKEITKHKKFNPEFRPAYELLIEYYKEKNNKKKHLEYINKLMALDDSYEKNYKYLFSKIHKEYDTNKLIQEKNDIQNSFKMYKYITIAVIVFLIIIVSLFGYKFYSTQKKIKEINSKKVLLTPVENENIADLEASNKNFSQDYYEKIPGLKADTVKNILNKLDNFEKNLGFLDVQLTQLSLSEKLETNASYLSKIFKVYKEKNYNVYIGDLRIDYIINLLNTDKKNWEEDIKKLANLGGFSNAENFSDHFKRKIGNTPSQYIKSLRKEDHF